LWGFGIEKEKTESLGITRQSFRPIAIETKKKAWREVLITFYNARYQAQLI
jgi:hypothetical protein